MSQALDFSFEYQKLNAIAYFRRLKYLDDLRRKLNEQLFLLDMQQEVSIKRYRTYLIQIGEHQQQENARYFESQNCDESQKCRKIKDFSDNISSQINEFKLRHVTHNQIQSLIENFGQLNNSISNQKEIIFNLTKQNYLLDNLNSKLPIKSNFNKSPSTQDDQLKNLQETYQANYHEINKLLFKKRKLLKQQERLIEELEIGSKIEIEMNKQLCLLQNQAANLVENHQWYPSNGDTIASPRNQQIEFYRTSLSIP